MPQIEEIINDSEDEMPQLDGAETSQANDAHSVRASHIQDSHVIDSDDESDGMPELVEAPNEGSSRKTAVVDSEDDDGEDDEDDDDDMPDLVDIQPEAYGRGATTIDEDSDDDMPELVDLGPTGQHSGNYSEYDNESSTLASSTRKLRYGDTTSLYDEASTCCNMAFLHILGVCSSSLVFKLKALINERKMVTTENIRANKSMVDAEARLMDLRYSMTAEKQKEEEDLIDQTWEEIGLLETKLLAINASLKATDLEFLTEIKRAHHRLQSLYGRRKAGKSFGKGSKASAERLQSERRYQEDNGRKGVMSEEAAANILGLAEIDKALKTLSNPKFRQNYLVLANDSQFKSKRRTPKYADMSEAEVQELRMPKKQEPVSSLMKRQRTGGLQRYNNNPNRIQRVILLEYPTQPTCPDFGLATSMIVS
ncbi:hypothetical protein BDR26DRAFT_583535 [Obelidium mucronatum]|nr:hypothetical protein BDR26DRAFT_583535 [Obelidium mucronatum]